MTNYLTGNLGVLHANPEFVAGSFGAGTYGIAASYTLAIAAGDDLVITADSTGSVGNALNFIATADGTAKASLDMDPLCVNADTVIEAVTGGTASNDWTITMCSGSGGGEGVNIYEDNTNKEIVIMYEGGVSTVSNLETAIAAATYIAVKTAGTGGNTLAAGSDDFYATNLSGGTAATWAEEVGNDITLHFTSATSTTNDAQTAINGISGGSTTCTGGSAAVMAAGDAVASQDLSGGVTTVAISGIVGEGFSVTQVGTGQFRVLLDRPQGAWLAVLASLQKSTPTDIIPQLSAVSGLNQIDINIWDKSDAALKDVSALTVHFIILGEQ